MDLQTFPPAGNQLPFGITKKSCPIAGANDPVLTAIVRRQMRPLHDLNQEDKNGRFLNIKDQLLPRLENHSTAGAGSLWTCKHSLPPGISFALEPQSTILQIDKSKLRRQWRH